MPSKSKSQQRFMGMVHALKKGELSPSKVSKDVKDAAKSMSKKDAHDFASTKHKGKPEKVKQETLVRQLIRKMVREIWSEMKEGGPGSGPHGEDNPFDREPSDDELADIEKDLDETKKRDYKAEYKKYGSSTKAKKYRAELNAYNRKKGTYGNGDGKDASHKGGKIAGFEKESVNRGRAEKSRLKKEGKLTEKTIRLSPKKDANFEPGQFVQLLGKKGKVKLDKKSVHKLAKIVRVMAGKHGMGWSFTEGKLTEATNVTLPNGVKVKIDFKGITFISKLSKPVFLDRSELMKFFQATSKYLREGKLKEGKGVDKVLGMANDNSFGKLGGKTVDAMSANLFKRVYDKANDTAKEKIDKMNEKQLYVFMTKLWSKFSKQVRI